MARPLHSHPRPGDLKIDIAATGPGGSGKTHTLVELEKTLADMGFHTQHHGDEHRLEAWSDYSEKDLLKDFSRDCCVIHPNSVTSLNELYQAYIDWATRTGMNEKEQLNQRAFSKCLAERGFEICKHNSGLRFCPGIGLQRREVRQR